MCLWLPGTGRCSLKFLTPCKTWRDSLILIEETLPKGRRSSSSFLMCAHGVCATWRPFKVKRRKRTAEQHELNTGNALYNTLPAHMCRPDSARVWVCVCAACMCVWRVCGMAANVKNQTTASPTQPTANQNVQPAAKSTAVVGVGVPRGVACGIKVPQCARARKWKGKEGTEAKRPQQNGRAVGQLASRKTVVGVGGSQQKVCVSRSARNTDTHVHTCTHTYILLHVHKLARSQYAKMK